MSAASVDTIVRGGQVVTASDVFEAAVAIKGDKIVALGPEALLPPADRVIDASGRFVLPGLIDCHLHIGPEYDDWKTAPLAAAQTGLTTLLPFSRGDLVDRAHREGEVLAVEHLPEGTRISLRATQALAAALDRYVVAPAVQGEPASRAPHGQA